MEKENLLKTDYNGKDAQKFHEPVGCPIGFFQDAAKRSSGDFFMVWDNDRDCRTRNTLLKNHVATSLSHKTVTFFLKNFQEVLGRYDWQSTHRSNGDFERGDKGWFGGDRDFFGVRVFQIKLNGFVEVFLCFLNRLTLACHAKLRARGHVPFAFMFNYSGQCVSHGQSIPYFPGCGQAEVGEG